MENWLHMLSEALNHVDYGVVLLDSQRVSRFMNRAFHDMWDFPKPSTDSILTLADIMEHERRRGAYQIPADSMETYIAERIKLVQAGRDGPRMLRTIDDRAIKFECIPLPEDGRMLTYADQTELVSAVEQLEALANTDDLTRLHNRRHLNLCGEEEVLRAQRYQRPMSVIMLDIDHFKRINDIHGHAAGDLVLQSIARCCQNSVRSSDLIGRIGGEEFAVILPETPLEAALSAANKLCGRIARLSIDIGVTTIQTSVSLGVASLSHASSTFRELLQQADLAMVDAKQNGRNQVRCR